MKKQIVRTGLCLLLLCGLVAAAVRAAAAFSAFYPAVSIRYRTPLARMQIDAAEQYLVSDAGTEAGIWPTFWAETSEPVKSSCQNAANILCLVYRGDSALIWPQQYVSGTAPGAGETDCCALSDALAWRLFGSTDIAGQTLTLGKEKTMLHITGVFSGSREMLLYPGEADAGYTAVELSGLSDVDPVAAATDFAAASGLGLPDAAVYGPQMALLAGILPALPLFLLTIWLLAIVLRATRGFLPRGTRRAIAWALCFCAALALPGLLNGLPCWMIPARWSDFAFWARLVSQGMQHTEEWMRVSVSARDIRARLSFVCLLSCTIGALAALAGALLSGGAGGGHTAAPKRQHAAVPAARPNETTEPGGDAPFVSG